jgi:hypothetical protein
VTGWSQALSPLVQRELDQQVRFRASRRNWAYPGPLWTLCITFLPLLGWLNDSSSAGPMRSLVMASILQTWLICVRAMVFPAVSVSHEIRDKTLTILRCTPAGTSQLLVVKLLTSVAPILLEQALLLPFNLCVYALLGGVDPLLVLKVTGLMGSATMFFGCLGLWLGVVVGDPEKAATNSRLLVFMGLIVFLALEKALYWPMLLVGILIWVCLVVQPPTRPGQAYHSGVAALVLLLLLPFLFTFSSNLLPEFQISIYNPLVALRNNANLVQDSALYLCLSLIFFKLTSLRLRTSI